MAKSEKDSRFLEERMEVGTCGGALRSFMLLLCILNNE